MLYTKQDREAVHLLRFAYKSRRASREQGSWERKAGFCTQGTAYTLAPWIAVSSGSPGPRMNMPRRRRHRPVPAACLQVALDRFDLFHGHLFLPHSNGSGGSKTLGLLFHAAEYPARCAAFPYHLGYCQANSTLEYEERAMDLRNIVYYQVCIFQKPECVQRPWAGEAQALLGCNMAHCCC